VDYAPDPGYETDQTTYSSAGVAGAAPLPAGAVVYDGSHGVPGNKAGADVGPGDVFVSFNLVHGTQTGEGAGDGYYYRPLSRTGGSGWRKKVGTDYQDGEPDESVMWGAKYGWGPLIGNPMAASPNEWAVGLRYDAGANRWFWFRDKAPAWATAADDIARLNQAILDYKAKYTAAVADAAAKAAQEQLDAEQAKQLAKQQAAEDAATARKQDQEQKQAEHEAAVAEKKARPEEERAAREAQLQSEIAQKEALTQAEIDAKAMEAQAAIEQRAVETAARLRAAGGGEVDEGDDSGVTATSDGLYQESYEPIDNLPDYGTDSGIENLPDYEGSSAEGETVEGDAGYSLYSDIMGILHGPNRTLHGSDRVRFRRSHR
jgi:hypothetical protein